ncbi:unnamed protein product [[Candida] boidinii]|nr:unnamed protein product [[Candida] boidinii]
MVKQEMMKNLQQPQQQNQQPIANNVAMFNNQNQQRQQGAPQSQAVPPQQQQPVVIPGAGANTGAVPVPVAMPVSNQQSQNGQPQQPQMQQLPQSQPYNSQQQLPTNQNNRVTNNNNQKVSNPFGNLTRNQLSRGGPHLFNGITATEEDWRQLKLIHDEVLAAPVNLTDYTDKLTPAEKQELITALKSASTLAQVADSVITPNFYMMTKNVESTKRLIYSQVMVRQVVEKLKMGRYYATPDLLSKTTTAASTTTASTTAATSTFSTTTTDYAIRSSNATNASTAVPTTNANSR